MQARFITLAFVIATGAAIWTAPRGPAENQQHANGEGLEISAAPQPLAVRGDDEAGTFRRGSVPAAPYAPGEIQASLLEVLALSDEGTPPDELLRLAQSIYTDLLNAGTAGVDEAVDFLLSGEDLLLAGIPGSDFDFQSLRLALIDALRQIGGIKVERALLGELRHTQSSAELEALADALEWLQPGVYREEILERALVLMTDLKLELHPAMPADSAPLFRVLQDFGRPDMAAELQKLPYWLDAYAKVALANLPDGHGLDTLDRLARRELRSSSDSRALHLLAQLALSEQRAEAALLELALDGGIPDSVWPLIGDILMGDRQLQLEEPPADPRLVGSLRGAKPFSVHTITDRQVQTIYSVNYSAVLSPSDAARRLALINRLLDAPLSPNARAALWGAYDLLNGHY